MVIHHGMRATPPQANWTLAVLSVMLCLAELWGCRPDSSNPARRSRRYLVKLLERFLSDAEFWCSEYCFSRDWGRGLNDTGHRCHSLSDADRPATPLAAAHRNEARRPRRCTHGAVHGLRHSLASAGLWVDKRLPLIGKHSVVPSADQHPTCPSRQRFHQGHHYNRNRIASRVAG